MANPTQLTHLVSLLDDDSPVVQRALADQLAAYGDSLAGKLQGLDVPLDENQRARILALLAEHRRDWLRKNWLSRETDFEKLETALSLLAEFLGGRIHPSKLSPLLDGLAKGYSERVNEADAGELASFLFREKGLRGEEWNYYHPDNSNLVHVIEKKRGIPISLTCVYMLVGARLGLRITGCNFPGHFLARVPAPDGDSFVDCFRGGLFMDKATILGANPHARSTIEPILENEISPETIVICVLNNLARAYERQQDRPNHDLMMELCHVVEAHERAEVRLPTHDPSPRAGEPCFAVGQLVRHRRYGYRGVVVDLDSTCQAEESWYRSNVTRPDRSQPWYRVLVHGSEQVTYAAESSLLGDDSREPVSHPFVSQFFTSFDHGIYQRNKRPWPRW
jgi:hemimethylated DNA binding protein